MFPLLRCNSHYAILLARFPPPSASPLHLSSVFHLKLRPFRFPVPPTFSWVNLPFVSIMQMLEFFRHNSFFFIPPLKYPSRFLRTSYGGERSFPPPSPSLSPLTLFRPFLLTLRYCHSDFRGSSWYSTLFILVSRRFPPGVDLFGAGAGRSILLMQALGFFLSPSSFDMVPSLLFGGSLFTSRFLDLP